ncbi:MAG: hypothetical protein FJY36_01995 [Betaproteobacteria bacterium]|nr:hypothetical protein [Betaproteobacteria bacterium]
MIYKRFSTLGHRTQGLLLCLLATACASVHAQTPQTLPSTISAHGDAFGQAQLAPKTQARVYAYRPATATQTAPLNLYINGRYLASLLPGTYTEFCTASGSWHLQAALNDAQQQHAGKQHTGVLLTPQAGQVLYLRIHDTRSRLVEAVPEAQALGELPATRLQQHTLPRAPQVQECSAELSNAPPAAAPTQAPAPAPSATKKPVIPREYALETDALFAFGKTELRPAGFNAIENLVHQVSQDYARVDRIQVIGYSDAIGPAKLNRKLSLERAQAVAERLKSKGLQAKKIQTEGHGSDELVNTRCHNSPTPANKACHAPNRRVVIVVYGVRR